MVVMNRREAFARLVCRSGWLNLQLKFLRGFDSRPTVLILAYHRINHPRAVSPFDPAAIDATPEDFERQVRFLKENFRLLTLARLDELLTAGCGLEGRSVIITFDDGYRDTYLHAYPILKKYAAPAVVFVTSGVIDRRDVFWWEKLYYFLHTAGKERLTLEIPGRGEREFPLGSPGRRREVFKELSALLNEVPEKDKLRLLRQVQERLGVRIPPRLGADFSLTWEQVRRMSEGGIEIGSHTVSHPLLSRLSEEELRFELIHSKRRIEEEIGKRVVSFCYPVGLPHAFTPQSKRMVQAAGYRLATSFSHGGNDPQNLDRFALKRIGVSRHDSYDLFRAVNTMALFTR